MKQMKKMILITVLSLLTLPAFASMTKIDLRKTTSPEKWEITKQDDGYIFLLWPEDPNKFIFHVDDKTSEGKFSDTVTVQCNGRNNRLKRNATLTCYGNFEDSISLYIEKEDFHNGAAGTSLLTPKK